MQKTTQPRISGSAALLNPLWKRLRAPVVLTFGGVVGTAAFGVVAPPMLMVTLPVLLMGIFWIVRECRRRQDSPPPAPAAKPQPQKAAVTPPSPEPVVTPPSPKQEPPIKQVCAPELTQAVQDEVAHFPSLRGLPAGLVEHLAGIRRCGTATLGGGWGGNTELGALCDVLGAKICIWDDQMRNERGEVVSSLRHPCIPGQSQTYGLAQTYEPTPLPGEDLQACATLHLLHVNESHFMPLTYASVHQVAEGVPPTCTGVPEEAGANGDCLFLSAAVLANPTGPEAQLMELELQHPHNVAAVVQGIRNNREWEPFYRDLPTNLTPAGFVRAFRGCLIRNVRESVADRMITHPGHLQNLRDDLNM